jgi:MFS family permease
MLSGLIDSFPVFYALRFLLGFFQSVFNPCAYSVISDYFHPDRRTLANSIFNLGIYFGGALSSITSAYINAQGWRSAYTIVGAVGVGAGAFGLFFIAEPERNKFVPKAVEAKIETNI